MSEASYEVAVVGAGPSGASAALIAAKAGKKTALIDDDRSVTRRAKILNHYGVAAITGPELVELGKKQATSFGAELVEARALEVKREGDELTIRLEGGRTLRAKHVVLASGLFTDLAAASGVTTKPGTEPRIKTIVDVSPEGKTNVPGVWAAGTLAGVSMHTIITAGDGAKVAFNIVSELNGERYVDHDVL